MPAHIAELTEACMTGKGDAKLLRKVANLKFVVPSEGADKEKLCRQVEDKSTKETSLKMVYKYESKTN